MSETDKKIEENPFLKGVKLASEPYVLEYIKSIDSDKIYHKSVLRYADIFSFEISLPLYPIYSNNIAYPYFLIDIVEIQMDGNSMLKVTGEEIYFLHKLNGDGYHSPEECLQSAKMGIILLPMPHFPMLKCMNNLTISWKYNKKIPNVIVYKQIDPFLQLYPSDVTRLICDVIPTDLDNFESALISQAIFLDVKVRNYLMKDRFEYPFISIEKVIEDNSSIYRYLTDKCHTHHIFGIIVVHGNHFKWITTSYKKESDLITNSYLPITKGKLAPGVELFLFSDHFPKINKCAQTEITPKEEHLAPIKDFEFSLNYYSNEKPNVYVILLNHIRYDN